MNFLLLQNGTDKLLLQDGGGDLLLQETTSVTATHFLTLLGVGA